MTVGKTYEPARRAAPGLDRRPAHLHPSPGQHLLAAVAAPERRAPRPPRQAPTPFRHRRGQALPRRRTGSRTRTPARRAARGRPMSGDGVAGAEPRPGAPRTITDEQVEAGAG